jgi:hypothetical protein
MGRPPLENKQRQIAVALPPDLRARLQKAATGSEHSVAMEIRQRLEQTFAAERADKATRELLFIIQDIAELIRTQTGCGWSIDQNAWDIFARAIEALLRRVRPSERRLAKRTSTSLPKPVQSDDPAAIAAGLEAIAFRSRRLYEAQVEEIRAWSIEHSKS